MIVGLPSGIGDCSWAYSKLVNVGILPYEIADGAPYRTVDYFELLPGCSQVKYANDFNYEGIVIYEQAKGYHKPGVTWKEIEKEGAGRVLLQPNHHLERGKRLEDWLPDLPTTFHYPIETSSFQKERAQQLLASLPRPILGFSCASYRGAQAWKTWDQDNWNTFLQWWKAYVGGTLIALGGGWDDLTACVASTQGAVDLVGKTHIGVCTEILREIDYYIGFSSGLGVIRTVLNKPVFMFWPEFQWELSTSWAPPDMLEKGTYQRTMWLQPEVTFPLIQRWLREVESNGSI